MPDDAIVEEVRAIREAIAEEHGNDVKAIAEALRRQQPTTVSFAPKRLSNSQTGRKAG